MVAPEKRSAFDDFRGLATESANGGKDAQKTTTKSDGGRKKKVHTSCLLYKQDAYNDEIPDPEQIYSPEPH